MSYENRVDFVKDYGRTKTNMMEKMKRLEKQGYDEIGISVNLLENKEVGGLRSLYEFFRLFKKEGDKVRWV